MCWMATLAFNPLSSSLTRLELSALSRLCGPDTRLTQVEEETASNSHLDGLAGLNLTSL
jgi:hypothetical protein